MAISRTRAMDKVEPTLYFMEIRIKAPDVGFSNAASGRSITAQHMRVNSLDVNRRHVSVYARSKSVTANNMPSHTANVKLMAM